MSRWIVPLGMTVAFFALLAVLVVIKLGVWSECRGQGNSFFYCWSLVSR